MGSGSYAPSRSGSYAPSRSGSFAPSQSGWEPSGNMVVIDEAELAELERIIGELQGRIEAGQKRIERLGRITEADILKFVVKNSYTAREGVGKASAKKSSGGSGDITIGGSVCPY